MDATHVFHSVWNRARGKRSSLPWLRILSTHFFFSRARDFTIFTLNSLTDFYVEIVTAQRIKRYDHSCFHNLQGGPLVFRGPYAACVFCV